jgi:methionine-rich copper-binding protein CopC
MRGACQSIIGRLGARALLASAVVWTISLAAPAFAHSFLIDASPSAKEHVATSPKTLKLRFGSGVEPAYSKLTLQTADGKVLAEGAVGKPDNQRELTLDVSTDLAPARYIVKYRVLSTDGHIVEGNYEFTVDAK